MIWNETDEQSEYKIALHERRRRQSRRQSLAVLLVCLAEMAAIVAWCVLFG